MLSPEARAMGRFLHVAWSMVRTRRYTRNGWGAYIGVPRRKIYAEYTTPNMTPIKATEDRSFLL